MLVAGRHCWIVNYYSYNWNWVSPRKMRRPIDSFNTPWQPPPPGIWTFEDWFVQIFAPWGKTFMGKAKSATVTFYAWTNLWNLYLADFFFRAIRLRNWNIYLKHLHNLGYNTCIPLERLNTFGSNSLRQPGKDHIPYHRGMDDGQISVSCPGRRGRCWSFGALLTIQLEEPDYN